MKIDMKMVRQIYGFKKKKFKLTKFGFTLVELLGVLLVLAIIALITFPIIDQTVVKSREESYNRTVESIIEAANNFSINNKLDYSDEWNRIYLNSIQGQGYLETTIINPITKEEMSGCVWYSWDSDYNQYNFEYDSKCSKYDTEPIVNISYNESLINKNNWTNKDIAVTITGSGELKYCIDSVECDPTETISIGNNTKFI